MAAIASIEIPRKEWQDLIPLLCENSEHSDFKVKLTSLQTLGFICEEIYSEDVDPIHRSNLISTLVNNIKLKSEIESIPDISIEVRQHLEKGTLSSIKALSTSISFARQNFEIESQRTYLLERICQACYEQNEDVVVYSLMCLRDISSFEYQYLEPFFG